MAVRRALLLVTQQTFNPFQERIRCPLRIRKELKDGEAGTQIGEAKLYYNQFTNSSGVLLPVSCCTDVQESRRKDYGLG